MELKRVVVTGLGAITPLGNDVETTWNNAVAGKSGAGPITHFDASKFKTQFACEVKDFDAASYGIDRKKARQLDLYAQYAMAAAKQAVEDANLNAETIDHNRVGVIVAAGIGGLHTFEEEAGYYAVHGEENGPKYSPFFIPKMIADIASGHISMEYGFHGRPYGTVSACASGGHASI
ncbi:MAG: beta-ketoacyl-[acyl-carrier-protein] synthase II, partial [Muribaculaceae bacterium]|nr:beta-ketoacyl-[acyl-carrier-protein] synthase II [Muribaculaceae bacterium]